MSEVALTNPAGAVGVAACATLSFVACITVFLYSAGAYFRSRWGHGGREGLLLLKTQFGALFLNLMVGDFIQAVGFGIDYIWYARGSIASNSSTCATQAVFIQVGDTASSLFTLAIAVHTLLAMALKRVPPTKLVAFAIASIWVVVAILAGVGPGAIKRTGSPFYAPAGGWCWISEDYDIQRLTLHYDIIFLTIISSTVLYGAVFYLLRTQSRAVFSAGIGGDTARSKRVSLPGIQARGVWPHVRSGSEDQKPGQYHESRPSLTESFSFPPDAPFGDGDSPGSIPRAVKMRLQRMDSERLSGLARRMLTYPFAYIIICLPLSSVRLATLAGDVWPASAQYAAGAIFTLSGLVNSTLAWSTRKELFSEREREARKTSALAQAAPHLGIQVAVEQAGQQDVRQTVVTNTTTSSHVRPDVREKMDYSSSPPDMDDLEAAVSLPGKPTGALGQPITLSLAPTRNWSDRDVRAQPAEDWYPPSPEQQQRFGSKG